MSINDGHVSSSGISYFVLHQHHHHHHLGVQMADDTFRRTSSPRSWAREGG